MAQRDKLVRDREGQERAGENVLEQRLAQEEQLRALQAGAAQDLRVIHADYRQQVHLAMSAPGSAHPPAAPSMDSHHLSGAPSPFTPTPATPGSMASGQVQNVHGAGVAPSGVQAAGMNVSSAPPGVAKSAPLPASSGAGSGIPLFLRRQSGSSLQKAWLLPQ